MANNLACTSGKRRLGPASVSMQNYQTSPSNFLQNEDDIVAQQSTIMRSALKSVIALSRGCHERSTLVQWLPTFQRRSIQISTTASTGVDALESDPPSLRAATPGRPSTAFGGRLLLIFT